MKVEGNDEYRGRPELDGDALLFMIFDAKNKNSTNVNISFLIDKKSTEYSTHFQIIININCYTLTYLDHSVIVSELSMFLHLTLSKGYNEFTGVG